MQAKSITFPGIALAVLLAILPFTTSGRIFFGAVNAKYFLLTGMLCLFAVHFAYVLVVKRHPLMLRGRWLLFLLAGALGILYLSSLLGVYPALSFSSEILRATGVLFLTMIVFLAFWAGEFLTERDWSFVRRAVAGSAALFALFAFFGSEGLGLSGRILTMNLDIDGLTLGNSTFAGAYLLIAFVITLIEFFRSDGKRVKQVLGTLALMQFLSPLLFNTQVLLGHVPFAEFLSSPFSIVGTARASSVAAFMVAGYLLGFFAIRRFVSAKPLMNFVWAGVWLLGIVALVGLLFVPGSAVQKEYIEQSTAARIIIWESTFEAIKERPLLGWGPENFRLAIDEYFDNRLYEEKNIGEVWFDRAHNLLLDTLISVGVLGLSVFALLSAYFVLVAIRAVRAGVISVVEANLLGVLIVAQVLQLQTSFDTITTYTLMAIMFGYALFLERCILPDESVYHSMFNKGTAGVLMVLAVVGSAYLFFGEYKRQDAIFQVFVTKDREQQIEFIHTAMRRQSDFETIRLLSASLTRGLFGALSEKEKERNVTIIEGGTEQLAIFGDYWRAYLEVNPDDYRARMNYAYQLLVQTAFGEAHLDEAKMIIENSYALSPRSPITYVLDGAAKLYSGDIEGAKMKMNEAVALNPDVPFSKEMKAYIERQEASFPEITVLQLGNL
jgi:O-antigen ligase